MALSSPWYIAFPAPPAVCYHCTLHTRYLCTLCRKATCIPMGKMRVLPSAAWWKPKSRRSWVCLKCVPALPLASSPMAASWRRKGRYTDTEGTRRVKRRKWGELYA